MEGNKHGTLNILLLGRCLRYRHLDWSDGSQNIMTVFIVVDMHFGCLSVMFIGENLGGWRRINIGPEIDRLLGCMFFRHVGPSPR